MRTFVTDRLTDGADYIGPEERVQQYLVWSKYSELPPNRDTNSVGVATWGGVRKQSYLTFIETELLRFGVTSCALTAHISTKTVPKPECLPGTPWGWADMTTC